MADASGNAHAEATGARLDRPLGLAAGVALVVGGVIGIGIYVLIGQVGAQAGSSQWLAFAVAVAVSAVGVLPLVQIASALPLAGGGFLFTSRLLSPGLGTVTSALAVLGGSSSTALVSWGMADYLAAHLPFEVPHLALAVGIPAAFFALYLFGLRLAVSLQALLALQLVVALVIYVAAGAASPSVELSFALELPRGSGGFVMATILCYSACVGFQVIAEMGEEMRRPSRNIPLSLLIGGAIVFAIYVLVGAVFVGSVPYDYDAIRAMEAPLSQSAELFLPRWAVIFLGVGALSAGLTSFNAGAIALPRELYSLGRDRVLPPWVGRVNERSGSPLNAVALYFGFTGLLILAGGLLPGDGRLDFYGVMTAVGILLMTAIMAVGAFRLPGRFPDRYARAYLRLPRPVLVTAAVVSVLSCLGFCALVLVSVPVVGAIYAAWTAAVVGLYLARRRRLVARDPSWPERFTDLPL